MQVRRCDKLYFVDIVVSLIAGSVAAFLSNAILMSIPIVFSTAVWDRNTFEYVVLSGVIGFLHGTIGSMTMVVLDVTSNRQKMLFSSGRFRFVAYLVISTASAAMLGVTIDTLGKASPTIFLKFAPILLKTYAITGFWAALATAFVLDVKPFERCKIRNKPVQGTVIIHVQNDDNFAELESEIAELLSLTSGEMTQLPTSSDERTYVITGRDEETTLATLEPTIAKYSLKVEIPRGSISASLNRQ